jgi:hypothetical protein
LKEANDIRIIGFSFPETDSHISYLFKTAIMENQNLKNIDVLCLDDNNSTIEKKYKSKFETDKLRFKNKNISMYLNDYARNSRANEYALALEEMHSAFFSV